MRKNVKLAVLIQCHRLPEQVNLLLEALRHEDITIFVHIDRKSDMEGKLRSFPNVRILPPQRRVDVQWAQFSMVEAELSLLNYAREHGSFDYYWMVSGQDFPIVSPDKILDFLEAGGDANYVSIIPSLNNGAGQSTNFDKRNEIAYPAWLLQRKSPIRVLRRSWVALTGGYHKTFRIFRRTPPGDIRFYFGAQWICVSRDFVEYALGYLEEHPQYCEFFRLSCVPDESFFQTLLMNSPFASTREDYLHHIQWSPGQSSPDDLHLGDFEKIIASGKLMTRKINGDYELIDRLRDHIKKEARPDGNAQ